MNPRFFDPTGRVGASEAVALAPRHASLRGARLGLIDNTKPNADRLLVHVSELLVAELGLASVSTYRKPVAGLPVPDGMLDDVTRECDVAVIAVGD